MKHIKSERVYNLIKKIYSKSPPENFLNSMYKSYTYRIIRDFVLALAYISNNTYSKYAILNFIDWYFENSNSFDEKYRITETDYKVIKLIVENELDNKRFCSTIYTLNSAQKLTMLDTDTSLYIYTQAKKFLNIKSFPMPSELSSEALNELRDKGFLTLNLRSKSRKLLT